MEPGSARRTAAVVVSGEGRTTSVRAGTGASTHCCPAREWMTMKLIARLNLKYLIVSVLITFIALVFLLPQTNRLPNQIGYSETVTYNERSAPAGSRSPQEMREIHAERRQQIRDVCERNGIFGRNKPLVPSQFDYIFVDEKHQFLYCMIPKVACTNWKRVLLVLSEKVNTTDPFSLAPKDVHGKELGRHLKTLDMYSPKEIQYRLDNYFKFMYVRDPFERLLSAYRNKFTVSYNQYFPQRYGKKIIKKYRKHPSQQALKHGTGVRFDEFVQYVIDPETPRPFNAHWRQYYKICHPCIVEYDAIGKYENMEEDTDYILRELGIRDVIKFPEANRLPGRPQTSEILQQTYANISSVDIHKLWETYSVDYAMFGYSYPEFSEKKQDH